MEKTREKHEKFEKLISDLDSKIICGVSVATKIQDSQYYHAKESEKLDNGTYTIGIFNKNMVIIDPNIKWGDLRIFDENNVELINLSNFGFETEDLI